MTKTAYIRLNGVQGREVVTYEIGPVFLTLEQVKIGWYRNSFRPQPIGATFSSFQVQIGDGQSGQFDGGSYVSEGSGASNPVIAVPDEMKTTPVPPRTLEHDMTFMTFFGEAGAPIPATRTSNTLVVGTGHNLLNGQLVTVRSTNTPPGGLELLTLYYVVSRTSTAISLALTPGGSVITLSTDGTGSHSVVPFDITGFYNMADGPTMSNNRPLGLL
jgi:hypothetical protein